MVQRTRRWAMTAPGRKTRESRKTIEQEDDVDGEEDGVETIVHVERPIGQQREEGGQRGEHERVRVDVDKEEGGETCSGKGAEDAESTAVEGLDEVGLLDEERGHGDPVAGLDVEAAVDFGGDADGDSELDAVAEAGLLREDLVEEAEAAEIEVAG